ncbi:hypothetical protein FD14_GL002848 [Secundilactobacillus similis DSM 23365 = JCM 2765]|uniref:Uncharacterized protein n=2 Tax=Secundilactobacillus similis TaxID=414682 RepID=A0A0R2ENI9_9LACO|nr:hypothetical protein FD14_GL002848 [Secundilactobacillus similis DSM 23365 = JCM 2765]
MKAIHLSQRNYQIIELLTSAKMTLNAVQNDASNVTTETVIHALGQQQAAIISALALVTESIKLATLNTQLADSLHGDLSDNQEANK